jgi:hypothetical protein
MSLLDPTTGMIHVAEPMSMESHFDKNGKPIYSKVKQPKAGIESTYINDAPCVPCPERNVCLTECQAFAEYVNPTKYKRKAEREAKKLKRKL